jgi:hypothetical protein
MKNRVLREKLIVCSASQQIPASYGIRRFTPCSQETATGHYPEPDEFNTHQHILFSYDPF